MTTAVIAWLIIFWLLVVLPARMIAARARRRAALRMAPTVTVVHQYPRVAAPPAGVRRQDDGALSWGVHK